MLLSGDTGFYSGTKSLIPLLDAYDVEVFPGISSLSYFCAKLKTSWHDAFIVSAHGREHNVVGEIQRHEKTFALTGGQTRVEDICCELVSQGLGHVVISVGERLSYPDEKIVTDTAERLADMRFDSLAVMLAINPQPVTYAPLGISDSAFLRGEVPMTREEIRTLAVSKLRIAPKHVVWDIGGGTGSVSVACALAANAGRVFSIEKNPAALALMVENKARFCVSNLEIIDGLAPDVLTSLPAPDRVFLGGTSGNLSEILKVVFGKNPAARIVIPAVTLETLGRAVSALEKFRLVDTDIAQVAITKTRKVGASHLLDAQNHRHLRDFAGACGSWYEAGIVQIRPRSYRPDVSHRGHRRQVRES